MSDSSVIKEFVVALGFSSKGAEKFEAGIKSATKVVTSLAVAVEATAVAVEAAVAKIESKFEDLYYASQRIGATVENIRAFGFAVGQMGGNSKTAQAALESMAQAMRMNPGIEGWLNRMGVATQAGGKMRQMTDIATDFSKAISGEPDYVKYRQAAILGIDPNTLQAMLRDLGEAQKRYHQLSQLVGIDQQKAAESGHKFENDLRDIMALVELSAEKVIIAIQPWADKLIHWLEDLHKQTDGWSTALIGLIAILAPLLLLFDPIVAGVVALGVAIGALVLDFQHWKEGSSSFIDWGEWAPQIKDAVSAIDRLGAAFADLFTAIKPVTDLLLQIFGREFKVLLHGVLGEITTIVDQLTGMVRVLTDLKNGDLAAAGRDIVNNVRTLFTDEFNTGASVAATATGKPQPGQAARATRSGLNALLSGAAGAGGAVSDHVLAFFQSQGWSGAAANGMTAGGVAESKLDPNAFNGAGGGQGAFGIFQWRGARLAELRRRYGPNPSIDDQLAFAQWELTHSYANVGAAIGGAGSASQAMQRFLQFYEAPGAGLAGDIARGGSALGRLGAGVSIHQKTDIHVHGSDSHATAREVANHQSRVNGNLVRQFSTVAT